MIRRLSKVFQREIFAIPGRLIAFVFFIALFFVPLFMTNPYGLTIFLLIFIYCIYAASWDVVAGFTGQMNFGQALFFGVAAYAAAFLNTKLGLPPWATIPLGAVLAVFAGLIVAIPALRLRGIYLSLVTLALPIMLTGIIYAFPTFTGGELGISGLESIAASKVTNYYILAVTMIVCVLLMWKITDTGSKWIRTGIIFSAIREDEIAARASAINTTRYKLLAFAISGFFAGIAGGLYAHTMKVADPSTISMLNSFMPLVWTVFGGMATIYGPVTGVLILYPIMQALPASPEVRMLIAVGFIILIILFMPEGITIWIRDRLEQRCPRCKEINFSRRRNCRICNAPLHLEREQTNPS